MKKFFLIVSLIILLPSLSQAEKIIDVTNSVWKETNKIGGVVGELSGNRKYTYYYRANGICEYSWWDLWTTWERDCTYTQEGNKVKMIIGASSRPNYKACYLGVINGQMMRQNKANCNTWSSRGGKTDVAVAKKWSNYLNQANTPGNKKKKESVPKIFVDDSKIIAASSGSGFFVTRQGHVITNHHVIAGCKDIKLSYNDKQHKAKLVAQDKTNDLAILKTDIRPKQFFPVSKKDVALLQEVVIAGFPLGKKVSSAIKTSKGSVTALVGFKDNSSNFQTDAAMNKGNSGGPIINNYGGVVGVAVSHYGKKSGVESFNFGIKSSTLKTFASGNKVKFSSEPFFELNNEKLGKLVTDATVYLECWMSVAKVKELIAAQNSRKAFFSEFN